jgi:catalase
MNPQEPDQSSHDSSAELRGAALIPRLGLIGVIVAGIFVLFLYAGGWFSPHRLSRAVIINAFETANGLHPGFRRNHAKGVCVTGYFESDGKGVTLSKAAVFVSGRVPVIGRFAFGGGLPYVADDPHMVRSLAVLFKLPDGEEWRSAMINLPVFPFNSAQGFYDQLMASIPDPATGKPDPDKLKAFLAKHPETAKAMQLIHGYAMSSGFANSTYYGLNAFRFINAQDVNVPVRWALVPVQPFAPINALPPENAGTNYLFDALIADIHSHPLQWHLIITVGQPGDSTADATIPWPPDRQQVDAGTLTIDQIESEDTSPARDINFDPLVLPNGITGSDDPLLSARSAAYSESFTRREGEAKSPSAVSPAETDNMKGGN